MATARFNTQDVFVNYSDANRRALDHIVAQSQLVTVTQTSSVIKVAIPQLTSTFTNVSQVEKMIKYQLQYFDFPVEQQNISAGDSIYVQAECVYTSNTNLWAATDATPLALSTSYDITIDNIKQTSIQIFFDKNGYISCEELAQIINTQIQMYGSFQRSNDLTNVGTATAATGDLLMLSRHMQEFTFDSVTQKYCIIMQPNIKNIQNFQAQAADYNAGNPVIGKYLFAINVRLYVDNTLSPYRQIQLARLIGADTTTQTTIGQQTYYCAPLIEILPTNVKNDFFYISPYLVWYQYLVDQANYEEFDRFSKYSLIYGAGIPSTVYCDFIYLRTSAQSSSWNNETQNKSDVFAILPWSRLVGDVSKFKEQLLESDIYAVGETLTGVRNLSFSLTDYNGVPLQLTKTYILRFAILQ